MARPASVDDYIAGAPPQAQEHLRELRALLREVAPDAVETLKWGSPVFEEKRILFSYTAHKAHINFMPTHSSLAPFEQELDGFTTGKDTLQLPYDRPLPRELIRRIAAYRRRDVLENGALWMDSSRR